MSFFLFLRFDSVCLEITKPVNKVRDIVRNDCFPMYFNIQISDGSSVPSEVPSQSLLRK